MTVGTGSVSVSRMPISTGTIHRPLGRRIGAPRTAVSRSFARIRDLRSGAEGRARRWPLVLDRVLNPGGHVAVQSRDVAEPAVVLPRPDEEAVEGA